MFPFNVRVYGMLINENNQVLVADEMIKGKLYTKRRHKRMFDT
jgi:hypothetical protein